MKCPFCDDLNSKVVDSRAGKDSVAIRRRRECLACHRRFTTYEKIEGGNPMVVKKDGRRETFDTEKLRTSILTATQKRSVSIEVIDEFIECVEKQFQETSTREFPSEQLGSQVMNFLKDTDTVAYVRFASVYRQFKDLEDFEKELKELGHYKKE